MKKIEVFCKYMDAELPKHKLRIDAFRSANEKFRQKTGLNGYSSYNSYLTLLKRQLLSNNSS